ncbi:MAG: DUF6518 family protein [Rhodococcus sp. (in: high G+C Gram-positive bacteria)]
MVGNLSTARGALAASGAGLLAAVVAVSLFVTLPTPWDSLANTSALWGLVPYGVAIALPHRSSVLLGIAAMTALVAGWIVLAPVDISAREAVVFLVVGVVAGAVCGAAGGAHRRGRHVAGTVVMSGLVLGESVYGSVVVGGVHWVAEAAAAVGIIASGCRTSRDRARAAAGACAAAAALFGFYLVYDAILAA